MKKQLFILTLIGTLIIIFMGYCTLRFLHRGKLVDETKTVFIKKNDKGFQLYRNGIPFYIKGASGNSHFKELAEIGGNAIRLYDTINLSNFLDEALRNDLAVIVDIPIPKYYKEYNLYGNDQDNIRITQKIKVLVKKYKSHPALLMWNLGNEVNYPLVFWSNTFIKTFNEIIDLIHIEDPNHPVCTSIAGTSRKSIISIHIHSPGIDLFSFNSFGDLKSNNYHLSQISYLFGAIPYYISEWGPDGDWQVNRTSWMAPIEPTSSKKIEQIKTRYKIITENNDASCLGSLVFYWGNKLECTQTWFSLFMDDHRSEVINEIENLWKKSNSKSPLFDLDYMLLDSRGALDNIVFAPGELKFAEVVFSKIKTDSVRIKWEIFPEVWYNDTTINRKKPRKAVNCFNDFEKNKANFITPGIEGPYRIFAYIYDQKGNFATTNTPFYVLNTK